MFRRTSAWDAQRGSNDKLQVVKAYRRWRKKPITDKQKNAVELRKMTRLFKKLIEKFAESKIILTFAIPSLNNLGA